MPVHAERQSGLLHRDPHIGQTREMLHPAYFELQVPAASRRQAIRLAPSRTVLLFDSLNPLFLEQPAQRAVERAGAEHNPSVAHLLDVLENGVPMPRLSCQAKKDE